MSRVAHHTPDTTFEFLMTDISFHLLRKSMFCSFINIEYQGNINVGCKIQKDKFKGGGIVQKKRTLFVSHHIDNVHNDFTIAIFNNIFDLLWIE